MSFKRRPKTVEPKIKEKNWMLCIDVQSSTMRINYDDIDSEDNYSYDRGSYFEGVTVTREENIYSDYGEENVPEDGESVFVLIECYDTGDTFGHENNCHSERGWFRTYEEAEQASETKCKNDGYFDTHNYWHIEHTIVGKKDGRRF